jgi:serine/threonine-protein kinase
MHVLTLRRWNGDRSDRRYQILLQTLRKRLGITTEYGAEPPRDRAALSRRAVVVGASAAVAVSAAGVGAWFFAGGKTNGDSVAVLPFANLSGDPAQAYFSDGIAEELRSALSRIPGLNVVARTSSEAVRNEAAPAAAAKLHVRNILTGSVRRSQAMLRVSAQLIDGAKGTQRWSEVYDRPVGDTLQIQSEIANMVAQALSIHFEAEERRALKEGATTNPEAQDLLLKAQALVWRNDDESALQSALDLVDRALSLDPRYADALVAQASILIFLGSFLGTSAADLHSKTQRAEKSAREAIRVAPGSARAHGVLADILWTQLQLRAGFAEFRRMQKLPGSASSSFNGFDSCVMALSQCRRFDEAMTRAEGLIATDPLNPNSYMTKAMTLAQAVRYSEAEQVLRQAIALGPELTWPRAYHGFVLMQLGRLDQAERVFAALGGSGPWLAWAAVLAERQGKHPEADRLIAVMEKSMGDGAYYQYAEVYAQQGRHDQALAALERSWTIRDPGLTYLQIDPMFDPLRPDPRFQALVKRLDFPT